MSRSGEPAQTKDGIPITLLANVDHLDEVAGAIARGAQGIGLFRTEYQFMASPEIPTEEEHYQDAIKVLQAMEGRPVTFRTLDLGADKISSKLVEQHDESNPALGLRSLRLCLTESVLPVFRQQLRGILRASTEGNVRLMFPMVSGIDELLAAKKVLAEVKAELREEGIDFDEEMPVGIMIEMPSAAMIADHLADEVDFFSIGTNDLIQYTMAVDRMNELVSYLYAPLHPAILRLISIVLDAANEKNVPVSICGEMAGDPIVSLVLLGMGLRQLSMHAVAMSDVKDAICRAEMAQLEALAQRVLRLRSAPEIRAAVVAFAESLVVAEEAAS